MFFVILNLLLSIATEEKRIIGCRCSSGREMLWNNNQIPYSIKLMLPLVGYRVRGNQISANKVKMLKRHYFVLSRFSLKNGRKMGIGALLFTMTHAFYSIYFRLYKRQL